MKILLASTDADHAMTLAEISAELAKYDIGAERKSLYDDLELLRLYGIDVQVKRDRQVRYYHFMQMIAGSSPFTNHANRFHFPV